MRQGRNLVSNSDFNRKRGEEYLKSSYGRFADGSNASVLISSSFTSENIVGGGQLRSNNYSASSRSIKGKRAYAHFKGGEGNYTSLMSSDFAGTETMLNPDHIVGGGGEIHLDSSSKKGGKPFKCPSGTGLLSTYGCESNDECPYTRNDLQKGGAGLTVCTPFHYEGGVC